MIQQSSPPLHQGLQADLHPQRRAQRVQRKAYHLHAKRVAWMMSGMLCLIFMAFLWSEAALAQAPRNFRTPTVTFPNVESGEVEAASLPEPDNKPQIKPARKVIVDTDPGVDDAVALIWLYSQPTYKVEVLGVVTVAGNTTVDFAVNNAQLILDWLGVDTPVIRGAEAPLAQVSSLVPSLVHGPDGLWFTFAPEAIPDPRDATTFYCEKLEPGVMVMTLGPMTNIAPAMAACPAKWVDVELVTIGGGRFKFNQTPVTEYNFWQDPEAAAQVVSHTLANPAAVGKAGTTMRLVLADAFTQLTIGPNDLRQWQLKGVPAIQNLIPVIETYMLGLSANGEEPVMGDPAAVIYALENQLGTAHSGLVDVLAGVPEVARGQTVIGLSDNEKVVMIGGDAALSAIAYKIYNDPEYTNEDLQADIAAILFSRPDNALVVTDIDAQRMHHVLSRGLQARQFAWTANEEVAETGDVGEMSDFEYHLFVPQVLD